MTQQAAAVAIGDRSTEVESNVAPITLVLDTNVFLDIHSCHDLVNDVDRLFAKLGNADVALDHPDVRFRVKRARESTLLAIYMNKLGTSTWSLRSEVLRLLSLRAPPKPGGTAMQSDFTTSFVHFVKDFVLPGWNPHFPDEDGGVSGDPADFAILDYAEVNSLPIVTNEGFMAGGLRDTKKGSMRRRGPMRGVRVYAPREFYGGRMNIDEEIAGFLARYRAQAPVYLQHRGIDDKLKDVLVWIHGYYRLILQGVVEGREVPLDLST